MNHVTSVAARSAALCSRTQSWPQPAQLARRVFGSKPYHNSGSTLPIPQRSFRKPVRGPVTNSFRPILRTSSWHCTAFRSAHFSTSSILRRLKPYDPDYEEGLNFRDKSLDDSELFSIFGSEQPEPEALNRLLRVLHARRVDGTLDIPLDDGLLEITIQYRDAERSALHWLRARYPVDEEQAVLDRFGREESPRIQEHPSALMERGRRLGLFKTQDESMQLGTKEEQDKAYYGPQSGQYYARLSDKDEDVFGRSEIEQIRKRNEAAAEEEEREMQERIDRSMEEASAKAEQQQQQKNQALAARPESGVTLSENGREIRPPNEFEKWVIRARERATTKLTLESPEVMNTSSAQRILPSLAFVLLCTGGLYLLTEYWEPPRRSERMMSNTSLAMATCIGIFGVNVAVFLAWKFPPALRLLNTYFIVIPAYPRALSMLGNVFSQHGFRHLVMNMFGLFIFGPSLHEDIGRANFLAIYLTSGLFGSLLSLTSYVLRGILITSSLGASGSIWGITAAYMWLHRHDNFSFIFIPRQWQDQFQTKGWMFLVGFVVIDTIAGLRAKTIDIMAHLTGMSVGVIMSALWEKNGGVPERSSPGRSRALLDGSAGQK